MSATDQTSDVIELLEQQHQEIRSRFEEVRTAEGEHREEAFGRLVRLLAVHETAEEMLVHPEARRSDADEGVVDARLAEESDAKQMLADLEKVDVHDVSFGARLEALREAVLAHAENEERQEFPLLRDVHDEWVLERMATQVKAAEAIAPTHPHPHGPESATGNMVVGPFVSIADRVRDAIKG